MSAPSSSFEMDSLDEKITPVGADTVLLKDTQDTNILKEVTIDNLASLTVNIPFTWAASDEDSPLSVGLLYTTEPGFGSREFTSAVIAVKNAPTGSAITVDILEETNPNSNVFVTIFSTLPTIDVNEFTSQTAATLPVFSDTTWGTRKRLQIQLTVNDSNFIASGLKVTLIT